MFRSIFVRLIIIVVAFGIALNIAIFTGFRRAGAPPPSARRLMGEATSQYFTGLARQIGDPPNTDMARSVAREKEFDIRIAWPGGEFSTRPDLPVVSEAEPSDDLMPPRRQVASGHHAFGPYRVGSSLYTFYGPPIMSIVGDPSSIAILLAVVSAMLGVVYLSLRGMLRPVRELTKGVDAVARGQFDYRIERSSSDELGRLATAFNDLATRIKEMMSAKEQLLIDVSHELRSPLARMKMAVELLANDNKKAHLSRDVSDMEKMVTELLETARLASAPGSISLQRAELVSLVRDHLTPYQEQSPQMTYSFSASEIHAEVDAPRFVTVLRNLVENALKYSDPSIGQSVDVKLVDLPDEVRLVVRDYGTGIPDAEIPRLFEPFYRVDKSRDKKTGGYGLGLSLCQRIVTAHGGKIEVESGKNHRGTTVTVMLPKRSKSTPLAS